MSRKYDDERLTREYCHVDGCETRFLGASIRDYIDHIIEEHYD